MQKINEKISQYQKDLRTYPNLFNLVVAKYNEGYSKAYIEGYIKGYIEGCHKGRKKAEIEFTLRAYQLSVAVETIAQIIGKPIVEIKQIIESHNAKK